MFLFSCEYFVLGERVCIYEIHFPLFFYKWFALMYLAVRNVMLTCLTYTFLTKCKSANFF